MILWNWLEGMTAPDVALMLIISIWCTYGLVSSILKDLRLRRK